LVNYPLSEKLLEDDEALPGQWIIVYDFIDFKLNPRAHWEDLLPILIQVNHGLSVVIMYNKRLWRVVYYEIREGKKGQ